MKPFNLKDYLADTSRKVVTRRGLSVRIICTNANSTHPIVALIRRLDNEECTCNFRQDGTYMENEENERDLFFYPKKGEGWMNIYRIADTDELEASCIFSTKEEAEFYRGEEPKPNYVATTRIEWEE